MKIFREKHKNDEKYLERRKLENKKFHYEHKKQENERSKKYYIEHREQQLINMRNYREDEENKNHLNELKKARNKIRRITDNNFLIKSRLRCLLYNSLNLYGQGKKFNSSKYGIDFNLICKKLGQCPVKREEWDIDHIIPCASFDLNKVEEVRKCFSPSNLQWLPKKDNIKKSNKLIFQL
ncbi:MAG: hypothetical protein M0R17_09475 [Candidatus Omnitrophica bacterium]|nr:hypothetical protein [Candidatus Omnitrophota bacterium]